MTLPESALRSLERLQELERQATPPPKQWRDFLRLKSENVFLLTLVASLTCLSSLLVLFVKDRQARERAFKEQQQISSQDSVLHQTREIPLGQFESISRSSTEAGNVAVVQYEAFLTTDARISHVGETERLIQQHKNKLRSVVETVVHQAPLAVLKEPNLTQLRKSLVTELNEVLGRNQVQDVQFSQFMHFDVPDTK